MVHYRIIKHVFGKRIPTDCVIRDYHEAVRMCAQLTERYRENGVRYTIVAERN